MDRGGRAGKEEISGQRKGDGDKETRVHSLTHGRTLTHPLPLTRSHTHTLSHSHSLYLCALQVKLQGKRVYLSAVAAELRACIQTAVDAVCFTARQGDRVFVFAVCEVGQRPQQLLSGAGWRRHTWSLPVCVAREHSLHACACSCHSLQVCLPSIRACVHTLALSLMLSFARPNSNPPCMARYDPTCARARVSVCVCFRLLISGN